MGFVAPLILLLPSVAHACNRMAFREPPDWVRNAGVKAFDGNEAALNLTIRITKGPTTFQKYKGLSICLVQPPNDNSLIRLNYMPGGSKGYDLQGPALHDAAPRATVIDIGANLGYVAISVAKMRPDLHVIAVEPAPLTFFYMLWNSWLNGVPTRVITTKSSAAIEPGLEAIHAAIGREGETIPLHFNPNRTQDTIMDSMYRRDRSTLGCGSIYSRLTGKRCRNRMGNGLTDIHLVQVPALDVVALLKRKGNEAGAVAMVKIDCEGCEISLLKEEHARRWFTDRGRVKHITGELHFHKYPGFKPFDVEQTRIAYTSRGCKWHGQVHVHC